ncbi:MAG: DUF721 domain-containing protein [Nitrospirae bacterium]|nr:MAG: DUF721 domain-containing protein [Nitrospirota bacterium]
MSSNAFTPARAILQDIAAEYGMESKLLQARLKHEWARIVGTPLALHTQPESLRFRTLTVVTENSVWMQQLVFLKPLLLARINEFAGQHTIADLIFRVGQVAPMASPFDPVHSSDERPFPPPSPSVLATATRLAGMLQRDELRQAMTALLAKALSASTLQ